MDQLKNSSNVNFEFFYKSQLFLNPCVKYFVLSQKPKNKPGMPYYKTKQPENKRKGN